MDACGGDPRRRFRLVKFVTFATGAGARPGILDDDRVYPLTDAESLLDVVRSGLDEALALGREARHGASYAVADVKLLAPLEPPTIRDFAAFEEHVEGMVLARGADATVPLDWYTAPRFYFSNPYAVVGPFDDVRIPPGCQIFDYELEVGAIIGRSGTDLEAAEADDHIFGYTILNDWSARDIQMPEMRAGLGPAKAKDTATTLGPYIVTSDELASARDKDGFLQLALQVAVNGVVLGEDLLSNMSWTFGELIAYASRGTEVRPGDVIGSGTSGNGGCLGELWGRYGTDFHDSLRVGDVVEISVERLGEIRNRVVAGTSVRPVPEGRRRGVSASRRRAANVGLGRDA